MTAEGDIYSAIIRSFGADSSIEYYIYAEDITLVGIVQPLRLNP